MKYYEEKKKALTITSDFSNFDGDVRKWQESYFTLLSYKNTFSSSFYKLDLQSTRDTPYVFLLVSITQKDTIKETMESLGYKNIVMNEFTVCYLEPDDYEDDTYYIGD